jgi:hypothetical protein
MATGKIKVRVTSKGQRIKRKFCVKGYKYDHATKTCKKISASERVAKKKAIRKALRTKKADVGGRKRAVKKRLKALKRRKSMGIK